MAHYYKIILGILIIVCFIPLSIFAIVSTNHNKKEIIPGAVDTKNIRTLKIHNISMEEKTITNKSDIENIINLINSVKITQSNVEQRAGVGFGVTITYSNGQKFSVSFLEKTMVYSNGDSSIWCDINKSIINDLRKYYDNN